MSSFNLDKIHRTEQEVEDKSAIIDKLVAEIIRPYIKDLDNYVNFIRDVLKDGQNPPTNYELEDMSMTLSTLIYFTSGAVESAGIRDDISKAIWKEKYNNARSDTKGTVQDKNAFAELEAQSEEVTNQVYHRAYATLKAKTNAAQELLSSVKKVLSHRLAEMELTRLTK